MALSNCRLLRRKECKLQQECNISTSKGGHWWNWEITCSWDDENEICNRNLPWNERKILLHGIYHRLPLYQLCWNADMIYTIRMNSCYHTTHHRAYKSCLDLKKLVFHAGRNFALIINGVTSSSLFQFILEPLSYTQYLLKLEYFV